MFLPSAARMTSVKCWWLRSLVNTLSMLFWWLFHLRQYCCCFSILAALAITPAAENAYLWNRNISASCSAVCVKMFSNKSF